MKRLILFGTGKYGMEAMKFFGKENILFFADNNVKMQGKKIEEIPVVNPQNLNEYWKEAVIVLAAGDSICVQMEYQLKKQGIDQFLIYRFIYKYLRDNRRSVRSFIEDISTESLIYKLMYLQEEEREKKALERVEFFMRNADIRKVLPATGELRETQIAQLNATVRLEQLVRRMGMHLLLGEGNLLGAVRNGGFVPWDDDMDVLMIRSEYNRLMKAFDEKGMLYVSEAFQGDESQIYRETWDRLNASEEDMLFSHNGIFLTVFIKCQRKYPIVIDIFPLDYYKDDCAYDRVLEYIGDCEYHCKELRTVKECVKYNNMLCEDNPFTSQEPTKKIGYGIDQFFILKECSDFCRSEYVYPLKKIVFEGYEFDAPCNPEIFLEMEYGDIYQWPSDAGNSAHGEGRRYIPYTEFESPVYISCIEDADKIQKEDGRKIIVEKYRIGKQSDYFDIIKKLEYKNVSYYVYA